MQTWVIVGLWFCLICNVLGVVSAVNDWDALGKTCRVPSRPEIYLVYARIVGQSFGVATLVATMLHLGLM
jgi:hypothetical protein